MTWRIDYSKDANQFIQKNKLQADVSAELKKFLLRLKGVIDAIYQLNFLSPKDYNKFFIKLRKDEAAGFRSELDVALRKSAGGDD